MRDRRGDYRGFVGRLEGPRPLGISRRRLKENIKIEYSRSGMGHGLDGCGSGKGHVAGSCKGRNEPSGSKK